MKFDDRTLDHIYKQILPRYPSRRAAFLPVLHLAQKKFGAVSFEVEKYLAELLDVPLAEVHGVASFYSMVHQKPRAKYTIHLCTNVTCSLLGSDDLRYYLYGKLGVEPGQVSQNGKFEIQETECLGCCGTAPVLIINGELFENITREKIDELVGRMV
ncbi:MAG: NAD(P)H-dependent oxidoreductase subunit E [Deltaproteobacteria bacterium]|nr:NAD(P)H-dependent oxidoreductase subunit E [Deltaproteobacteria bacterium]